jgi:hypothetical protein
MSIKKPKGFLQFTPFTKPDEEQEDIVFINENNSDNCDIYAYNLPFFEIEDTEDPVIVCPEFVKASKKNELSALDWP